VAQWLSHIITHHVILCGVHVVTLQSVVNVVSTVPMYLYTHASPVIGAILVFHLSLVFYSLGVVAQFVFDTG